MTKPATPSDRAASSDLADAPTAGVRWAVPPIPLAAWLLVQIGCLAVSMLDVPLAAQVRPGESMAVAVLLAGQIAAAALLAPALARSWAATALMALTAWPPLLLAGAMQSVPLDQTASAGTVVMIWLAGLAAWSGASRSEPARRVVSAVATLLSLGGPLASYLAIEFASDPAVDASIPSLLRFGPMIAAWNVAGGEKVGVQIVPLTLTGLLGFTLVYLRRPRRTH